MKKWLITTVMVALSMNVISTTIPSSERSERAIQSVSAELNKSLHQEGLEYGAPIFIRIFKATSKLEVWIQNKQKRFELFREYDICSYSGDLGPKTRQGDNQAPEGFYFVRPRNLNPWSAYHLSFNLGYPNAYDRSHGRTGSALMVHGKCVSIGCYAMTDQNINEIYALAHAAFESGQPFFRVHIFPFELEDEALERYKEHKWHSFWSNLKTGYDLFNTRKVPPNVVMKNRQYHFEVE